ncbi:hypothetical protein [Marisediminicola sp. LYQ134]|uniref:hypothetical protein n=1 Tax=unclassified Marisediminicola TaxID=2618316 RepID=UPI0039838B1D
MRKYIFSSSVIAALFSGWSTLQATKEGPRDWRLLLMWVGWGVSLAIAIGTVIDEDRRGELDD